MFNHIARFMLPLCVFPSETRGKIVWILCWLSLIQLGMQSVHGMSSGKILGTAIIYLMLLLRDFFFFFFYS